MPLISVNKWQVLLASYSNSGVRVEACLQIKQTFPIINHIFIWETEEQYVRQSSATNYLFIIEERSCLVGTDH